jgi:hypothetical protein
LIVIGTSNGSRRHHQVPCGGKDLLVAEFLPKLDIEIPPGILLADQGAHYQAIGHVSIIPQGKPGDRRGCQRISGKRRRKSMAVSSVPG